MGTNSFTIIGAGPAGLAAAYALAKSGRRATVLEQDAQVGGLSKTVQYKGFRFDIGGHRFFTKNQEVDSLWREILGDEFLRRPRQSRIFYRGKLFNYPLKPLNALMGLGPWTSAVAIGSFLKRKLFPRKPETNFEDWVSNRFGDSLYGIFFKTYTEKVWGIPCRTISADWAAQRIRNLDLGRAVFSALGIGRDRKIASLIDEFDYPRHGPGQMYEQMAAKAVGLGAELRLQSRVVALGHRGGRIESATVAEPSGTSTLPVENLISSMPLSELVLALDPPPAAEVVAAARALRYRSILTVNLLVRQAEIVPDTWIYIHSPEIRAGRLQLYKNWSPDMVPDAGVEFPGARVLRLRGRRVLVAAGRTTGRDRPARSGSLGRRRREQSGRRFRVSLSESLSDLRRGLPGPRGNGPSVPRHARATPRRWAATASSATTTWITRFSRRCWASEGCSARTWIPGR